ncbi:hypothetical protein FACS1894108_12250 [Planctomycetales bacterium]|nr:hypothetical protein FACS1894108_12250 [Planctomycetales bacterium]
MHRLLPLLLLFSLTSGAVFGDTNPRSTPAVPKTLAALQTQTGKQFFVAQRGSLLIAADLPRQQFDYVVNGIVACCQKALERTFFTTRLTQPVTIYIFQNKESYARGLKKFFLLDPISPYGHYGHRQRYIVINYQTGPGTLVHELVHALMAADFPDAPIWISEGLASLYEQCRVEDEGLLGEANWRLPELQKALSDGKTVPLERLFGSDAQNFRLMDESLHYAQSRYFCLYLQEIGKLRTVYQTFRDNVKDDRFGVKSVEMVLQKTLPEIERDWLEWVARQRWSKK